MAKIKLQFTLKNNTEKEKHHCETTGILKENKILFQENDIMVTILIKENKVEMKRNHEEYSLYIPLQKGINEEGYYNVYKVSKMNIKTKTETLKITKNSIKSIYDLYINEQFIGNFKLDLTLEVIK